MIYITTVSKTNNPVSGDNSVTIERIADGEKGNISETHSIIGAEEPKIEDSIQEEINYMIDNDYKITKCFKSHGKFILIGEAE